MLVIVNPYHRSVTIDGEEVVQKILEFPNTLNHLSTISCTYDETEQKITKVHDLHRFTSNFIQREYFFDNLPEFVTWFYAEKQAQIEETARQQKYKEDVENAVTQTVQAGIDAQAAISTDKTEALGAIESKHLSVENSITNKRTEALTAIQNAKTESLNNITETTDASVNSVTNTMNTALNAIGTERNSAVTAISNDKVSALAAIDADRHTSLDEINSSINKATAQADRAKDEADRAKIYADSMEAVAHTRPATDEALGVIFLSDAIDADTDAETGMTAATPKAVKDALSTAVHLQDDETISGTKTFSETIVGNISGNAVTATNVTDISDAVDSDSSSTAASSKAVSTLNTTVNTAINTVVNTLDTAVVHKTGNETVSGVKTFENVNATVLQVQGKDVATAESVQQAVDSTVNASTAVFKTLQTTGTSRAATGFKIADGTDLSAIFTQNGVTAAEVATSGSGTYVNNITVGVSGGKLTITKALGTPPDTNTHCTYCGYCSYCRYCSYCSSNCNHNDCGN